MIAYIALGANQGDPRMPLEAALTALAALPHTRLEARSSFYRTAPIGYENQPDFINAVARLETTLEPSPLLDALQAIEEQHGRKRTLPNGPRTLDLDLLLHGDTRIRTTRLSLPHPRMHERAFVLVPLAEIAPDLSIPGRGRIRDLIERIRGQAIERLSD
ncbi:MAG TPA: 2-amino-4-hydroxy-6-hydroxymethyldihydropteridine diphosphokinase [Rhodocyclaceae bacterium]|nr:2-amino-4-hydroxy-6-hydroxymethyldihydropteridine diphosphokinase [Rhodocyclaceae bacterium]